MSVCIVQNILRKKLNILCNQIIKFFLQIPDTKTVLNRMNNRGLYYIRPALLWNITQILMVISF